MIVPLAMTLYFSFRNYNLLTPGQGSCAGLFNYSLLLHRPGLLAVDLQHAGARARRPRSSPWSAASPSRMLIDQPIWGQGIVRILVISPFFVMPPVAALIWKNMLMHPGYGVFADIAKFFGAAADRLVRRSTRCSRSSSSSPGSGCPSPR